FKLRAGRRKQKITLVAGGIGRAVQLGSVRPHCPAHIMPGGECRGAEFARGLQQITKLDALIAPDARDRCLAAAIGFGEIIDHFFAEPALVIEHVMRDAETVGDVPSVADVLAGAAGTLAPNRGAVVVKLQCDADDLDAPLDQESRGHRRIYTPRHRDDDAVVGGVSGEVEVLKPRVRHFNSNCYTSATFRFPRNFHCNSLVDRDRGTPCGATPPTPPGVRVTYHGGSTGLSLDRDIETGETERVGIVVTQGLLDRRVSGHA